MVKSPILQQRLRNQRLLGNPLNTPEDVVSWLGAVQAQDYSGAKWALGLRGRSFSDEAVDRAFDEGRILRTHLLRPTWHFVAPADLRSFLAISGPRVQAFNAYYYRKFELEARHFVKSHAAIEQALQGRRFLTRAELSVGARQGANRRPWHTFGRHRDARRARRPDLQRASPWQTVHVCADGRTSAACAGSSRLTKRSPS